MKIKDDEDEEGQQEKAAELGTDNDVQPDNKQSEVTVNDDDEPMAENKTDENLNNGSPNQEIESLKGNNEVDDGKELADGEIADMSGDESKAADAPETIDLGKLFNITTNLSIEFLMTK